MLHKYRTLMCDKGRTLFGDWGIGVKSHQNFDAGWVFFARFCGRKKCNRLICNGFILHDVGIILALLM